MEVAATTAAPAATATQKTFAELTQMRETIENMSKHNQIEVLRLLVNSNSVIINENKYGIHINMSDLNAETLKQLSIFIDYVQTQEQYLNDIEQEKQKMQELFEHKDAM